MSVLKAFDSLSLPICHCVLFVFFTLTFLSFFLSFYHPLHFSLPLLFLSSLIPTPSALHLPSLPLSLTCPFHDAGGVADIKWSRCSTELMHHEALKLHPPPTCDVMINERYKSRKKDFWFKNFFFRDMRVSPLGLVWATTVLIGTWDGRELGWKKIVGTRFKT